jgi:hypothetical protein
VATFTLALVARQELEIRVPYTAWGDGDEWQAGYEELMVDIDEALERAGAEGDDADHEQDYITFYASGQDVDVLVRAVRPVLMAHGFLDKATGVLTDLEANDDEYETVIPLQG